MSDRHRQVLVAPIGVICDHVETLYGIDIGLKKLAQAKVYSWNIFRC